MNGTNTKGSALLFFYPRACSPPTADEGQDGDEEQQVAQGYELEEAGQCQDDGVGRLGIGHMRVVEDVDKGGEQGDNSPG